MILARQVANIGLAALGDGEMSAAHALRGLMAATLTVSSAAMDRVAVVSWLRALAGELEEEETAQG